MMLHLLMVLLASGSLCSHIHREYHLVTTSKSWDEAQTHCRHVHSDLATIGCRDDMDRLVNMTAASGATASIWIGLRESGPASWLWSVGETHTSQGLVEYTNWASLPSSSRHCGGMRGDGKWFGQVCDTKLPFVCQEANSGVYIVTEGRTWKQAQDHCRLNNGDLASVMSQTENLALQRMISENKPSLSPVWIGLFKDEWRWSDGSNSSFRDWEPSQPNDDGVCVLYNSLNRKWYDRHCASKFPFFCYDVNRKTKETQVTKMIVKVEIQTISVADVNEFTATEAILKGIQNNHNGIRVYWRVQLDGEVFRKKEKKQPVGTCVNVT